MSPIRRAKDTVPDWQSAGFGNVVEDVGAVEIAPFGAHVGDACVAFPVDVQAANDSPRTTTPKTLDRLVTGQIVGPHRSHQRSRRSSAHGERQPLAGRGRNPPAVALQPGGRADTHEGKACTSQYPV